MHMCPMVTPGVPPIPHVGGPILPPGQPTVLIAGMPASVVGDMCVCVGPPDAIAMGSTGVTIGGRPAARMGDPTVHGGMIAVGCPTVLIGETGGGGGGGGGGSSSSSGDATVDAEASATVAGAVLQAANVAAAQNIAAQEMVSALTDTVLPSSSPTNDPTRRSWVEIELIGDDDAPVRYARYRITTATGEVREGWTDESGRARVDGLPDGDYTLALLELDADNWHPA